MTNVIMRTLIFNKKDKVFFVQNNKMGQFSLFDRNPTVVEPVDTICRLKNGEFAQLVVLDVDSRDFLKSFQRTAVYTRKKPPTYDLFLALKMFFILGQLSQLAHSFDDEHKQEKDYTHKIIGLLKPIMLGLDLNDEEDFDE